jgi:non-canonical poly(A) RNA polymerase PAPD5/7
MSSGLRPKEALHKLGACLRGRGFERVQCIDNAKVPIVKCVDEHTGIHVDVSFDVANGPANVASIKQYLARYPALRPLVLVIKCFLLQRKLNEVFSGGIGSYCLILLVMSHLQMYSSNFRQHVKPSLGLLLVDFFHLYGKLFNYSVVGVAPRGRGTYFSKVSSFLVFFVWKPVLELYTCAVACVGVVYHLKRIHVGGCVSAGNSGATAAEPTALAMR